MGGQGQGRVQAERAEQDLGRLPLLGSVGGGLWGFWAKAGLFSSKRAGFW